MKHLWHKLLIWLGIRKPELTEEPVDISFVIMGLGDFRQDWWAKDNKVLPSDNKNRMYPTKDPDVGYFGQTLPNPWQPEAKLKYHYIVDGQSRYFDKPQEGLIFYSYLFLADMDRDFNISKLEWMKAERDKADILVRLSRAKDLYEPKDVLQAAINEIERLRDDEKKYQLVIEQLIAKKAAQEFWANVLNDKGNDNSIFGKLLKDEKLQQQPSPKTQIDDNNKYYSFKETE